MSVHQPLRGRPRAGESALIVERILDAAWDVLLELGPEHFSIDRVATVAHASKRTIYARFASKLELLRALLEHRVGMIFTTMRELPDGETIIAAFTDQARRSVESMISPESRILDRLIDWIDAATADSGATPTRAVIYEEALRLVVPQLAEASRRWGIRIDDDLAAAAFWLDGLFGHVRGLPFRDLQRPDWPATHARYFLRAVCV